MVSKKIAVIFCLFFLLGLSLQASADFSTFHADYERSGVADSPITLIHGPDEYNDEGLPHTGYRALMDSVPLWINQGGRTSFIELGYQIWYGDYNFEVDLVGETPLVSINGSGTVNGTPSVVDGKVYFGTGPSSYKPVSETPYMGIWCVDFTNDTLLWNTTITYDNGTPAGAVSGITVYDGLVYAGGIDGRLYCLDAATGDIVWRSPVIDGTEGTGLSSTPLVLRGDSGNPAVYVTAADAFVGYSLNDGNTAPTEICRIRLSGNAAPFSSPAYDGTYIYTAGNGGVLAVSPEDGSVVWTVSENYGLPGTPVYGNGKIYFTTEHGLYALNAQTGGELWRNESQTFLSTAPAVKDDIVVANSETGLSAFGTDGTWKWTHDAEYQDKNSEYITTNLDVWVSRNSPVISGDMVIYTANILNIREVEEDLDLGVPGGVVTIALCGHIFGVQLESGEPL